MTKMAKACRASNVYVIQHVPSGRVYVGKANDVKKRWKWHLADARRGKSTYLCAAIRKYGAKSFALVDVFPFPSEEEAYVAEVAWVKHLQANVSGHGFNSDSGGMGGKTASGATRAKMSAAGKGRAKSPEHRAKISASHMGKTFSIETIHRMSVSRKGWRMSPETRAKMSASRTGKKHSAETIEKMVAARKNRHNVLEKGL